MKNRRHLNRTLLGLLPKSWRFAWMRKKIQIDAQWPSPLLEIKIAETEEELRQAYQLLHDSYVEAGYTDPDPSGLRVLRQHLLPQTTTIVAKWSGKVVGTLSLIRDNPFGLPLEKIFDLSEHRRNGRRLAEVSSLALDPAYRGKNKQVLFPLIRFCIQYARHCFGIHEFVIATTASMANLYLGLLCFEKLKEKPKPYDFVNNTVAVGTYMNCETIVERWKEAFAHRPSIANLYRYLTEIPTDPRNQMPERPYHAASDPIMTPHLLADFFLDRAQLARRLSYKDVQTLLDVYPFPEFQSVLRPLLSSMSRKNLRMDTFMKAQLVSGLVSDPISAEVLNVSKEGLLLRTDSKSISLGQKIELDVWLNESTSTRLKVEVRWRPSQSLFGLTIVDPTDDWNRMVETLEQAHRKRSVHVSLAA